jgi:hypothetical protein
VPGGQGSSPICLLARRPCAVGSIACDRLTRASAGLFGLGRLRRVSYALSGATFFGRITQFVVPKVTSPRPCLRFDVMRSRPPCLRESIAQRKALRAATRLYLHDRFGHRSLDTPASVHAARTRRAPAILAEPPLLRFSVPCNAHWLRSRCPGRPASGRSRFGVSIHTSARAFSMRPADEMAFVRPCGFPLKRIRCDEARVADVCRQGVPIESVARAARVDPMGPVYASVSAGRRSVALTYTSSIARAGEIGETDPRDRPSRSIATSTRPAHRPPGATLMSSRSRATLSTRAPSLGLRRPQRVIRQIAPSSRGVPLPAVSLLSLAGRRRSFPFSFVVVRRRSWGSFAPFAGSIPQPGGRVTRASAQRTSDTPLCHIGRHFCRSGPTCRSCLCVRPDSFSSG